MISLVEPLTLSRVDGACVSGFNVRMMGKLITLVAAAFLLNTLTGCSRDPKVAQDSGQKIDLTLPKMGNPPAPQKAAADMDELGKKEEKQKREAAPATIKRSVSKARTSQPTSSASNDGKAKRQEGKTTAKQRDPAATSQQRRNTAPNARDESAERVVAEPVSRPSEREKRYQESDNPLHPSHKK